MRNIALGIKQLFGVYVSLGFAVGAQAQSNSFPNKPIKLVVGFVAGSATDTAARIIAERLRAPLGQQVVVENRPGGQNVIGTQAAARSAPDGYNFFYATTAAMVTNGFTFKTLPFDLEKD